MLTRIEINGFKNLVDFTLDFGPFTSIAGQNAVGKSNLFDAIRFLSLLTDHTIMEAALFVRGGDTETSNIHDLFRIGKSGRTDSFKIAAEMIVERDVRDDFGRPAVASSTYLRYEIEIGYEPQSKDGLLGRVILLSESLNYITEGEGTERLRFPNSASRFRDKVVINRRRSKSGFISVRKASDGQTEVVVHQDGGGGLGQTAPASTAPRTIVGTSNTSVTPTILAARREMQRWRFLALEPSAMRRADRFQTDPHITQNGGHLPATVNRLVTKAVKDGLDKEAVYAGISSRLSQLVPIKNIQIDIDEVRQLLTLEVEEESGVKLPAASLSDGTLRFLTLAVLVADPEATGLVCIEEPENGIHPAKMAEMVRLLKDLSVEAEDEPGPTNPFRQVIVATHSPVFVQLQDPNDIVFAMETLLRNIDGSSVRTLRCRSLDNTWRALSNKPTIGMASIIAYLSTPPGAQLELPELTAA